MSGFNRFLSEGGPYRKRADEVLAALGSDAQLGLSHDEARRRLERHGPNELAAERPTPAWKKFLAQFANSLVVLLLVASAISAALWLLERESALPYEAIAILSVVLLNALLGYIQEARAEQAVAALRRMSAAHASVVRGGTRQRVPATEVVPGDILLIEEGDTVPADARVISATALQTAEAALTGESLPVSKDTAPLEGVEVALGDRRNMIFSGTAATYGRGKAVVTATAMQTEMGRIAGMLKEAQPEATPLQKELTRVGRVLGIVVMAIAAAAMARPPRPRGEGVITGRMWIGILYVGAIMAAGALVVLDASLPGGFIEGSGDMRYAQTMAFNTLVLFSLFNVFNARSDERSAFAELFTNGWLWASVALSLALQVAVIYAPFLQQAFSTAPLSAADWLFCTAVASSVLWLRELTKFFASSRPTAPNRRL